VGGAFILGSPVPLLFGNAKTACNNMVNNDDEKEQQWLPQNSWMSHNFFFHCHHKLVLTIGVL
jgi:hypothetical protein